MLRLTIFRYKHENSTNILFEASLIFLKWHLLKQLKNITVLSKLRRNKSSLRYYPPNWSVIQ